MFRALLVSVALVASVAGCTGKGAVDQTAGGATRFVAGSGTVKIVAVSHRRPAPEISGTTLDGASLNLTQFKGEVVVLNVWGSWCGPCRRETPFLVSAATDLKPLGVQFVGVNVKDSAANARAFVRTHKVPYPSIFDRVDEIPARFRDLPPAGIPSTLILDRSGRAAASFPGPVKYSELAATVRSIAAEPA